MTKDEAHTILSNYEYRCYECDIREECDKGDYCLHDQARSIAIECIKKQIAKKPIGDGICRYCPVCSRNVGYIDAMAEAKLKYCNDCGQAISWEGEE